MRAKVTASKEMSQVSNSRSLVTDTVLFITALFGGHSNADMAVVSFPV